MSRANCPLLVRDTKARIHELANRVERILYVFEVKKFYEGFSQCLYEVMLHQTINIIGLHFFEVSIYSLVFHMNHPYYL